MKTAKIALITSVCLLVALGFVMLFSSSMVQTGAHYLVRQAVAGVIGLFLCLGLAWIDYRRLRPFALPLFLFTILLLALVLIPGIGEYKNGARRWFKLGSINFQPSELAKVAVILMLAWYGERFSQFRGTFIRGLVVPGGIVALALSLIFVEPDRGTTILLLTVTVIMLLLAGAKWWHLAPATIPVCAFIVWSLLKDPIRLKRIVSWLDLEQHKADTGYQAWQSMLALGAGGTTGLGLGNGRQKLGFVPEHHTDFIFSIIGEELGLIATVLVLVTFLIFIFAGLSIAWRSRDSFGFLLAAGITFLIGFQTFINIGVVTNLLPNKGLPLPFISYGGSSLVFMLICVGMLLSIARHTEESATEEDFDPADLPSPSAA